METETITLTKNIEVDGKMVKVPFEAKLLPKEERDQFKFIGWGDLLVMGTIAVLMLERIWAAHQAWNF